MAQIFESDGTVWIKQEPISVDEQEEDPLGSSLECDPIKRETDHGDFAESSGDSVDSSAKVKQEPKLEIEDFHYHGGDSLAGNRDSKPKRSWPFGVNENLSSQASKDSDESELQKDMEDSSNSHSTPEEISDGSCNILKSALDLSSPRNEESSSPPKKPRVMEGPPSHPQVDPQVSVPPKVNPNAVNPLTFLLNKRLMCKHCDFVAATASDLRQHTVAAHRDIKILLCPHCEYTTKTSTRLKNHIMARHTKEKPLSCPFCDYCTIQTSNLKNHITARHATLRQLSCQHCAFTCSDPDQMKNHVASNHHVS